MNRTYSIKREFTDWGPFISKLIVSMPEAVKSDALSSDTFSVYVERRDKKTGEVLMLRKSYMSPETAPSKGYCPVTKVYASDVEGNQIETGNFATIELAYGPIYQLASTTANMDHNVYVFNDFCITQTKEIKTEKDPITGLVFDHFNGRGAEPVQGWINGESTYSEMPIRYGYYTPATGSGKRPLIIWLHGAGEGGYDTAIAYTGNKVVNLSSPKIQKIFDGAYVLAPQIPTMWMDDGSGQYTQTGKSKYVKGLKALIDEFLSLHADVDINRVYIGGCSNGGFMTMRMIVDYPGFFAAAYPVCEALYDAVITDKNIADIKDTPIWFTHAKNDTLVSPDITVVPTYKRLLEAGAANVHFSFLENVVDTSGLFKDVNGKPFEYFGHASWIYMLNDECVLDFDGSPVKVGGNEVTLLQWLAMQSK